MSQASPLATAAEDVCRIIVVDDSAVTRNSIARVFSDRREFMVVATADNGRQAVLALQNRPADVVILDIDMPVMDGLTAIPHLKAVDPGVQIIMASMLTQKSAEVSLKALALGATDYIAKPAPGEAPGAAADFNRELTEKVRALSAAARRMGVRPTLSESYRARALRFPDGADRKIILRRHQPVKPAVIAIGSSTGGPQALFEIIRHMGADLLQPVVITQHMPPTFTAILADHIAQYCRVSCMEATDGAILRAGHYYVAPGDRHMLVARRSEGVAIKLTGDPPENYCRPAVDPMLRSLVDVYGGRVLAVILTGMGQDGWRGSEAVVNAGGGVLAQDEATSVVWGMPAAVAHAGLCSAVLPVGEIGHAVRQTALKVPS